MKDYQILQSKLKRNKISCKIEGQRVIIGKAKIDTATFLGLVILPFIVTAILVYLVSRNNELVRLNFGKIIFGIIFLVGTSLFYLKRMVLKHKSNKGFKILYNNRLTIETKNNTVNLGADTIENITVQIEELKDDFYLGRLIILSKDSNEYTLFEFEDETQSLLINDLEWLSNYFVHYLKLDNLSL
ncbi:MAG: hypothetical protein JXR05_05150 [Flavobacteriaceae bacterium]